MNCCVCLALGKIDMVLGYVPAATTIAGYATCQEHAELIDVFAAARDGSYPPLRMALQVISGEYIKRWGIQNPAYKDIFEKYGPSQ